MSQDSHDNPQTPAPEPGAMEEAAQTLLAPFRLHRPPFWMIATFLILVVLTWIPLVVSARSAEYSRVSSSASASSSSSALSGVERSQPSSVSLIPIPRA